MDEKLIKRLLLARVFALRRNDFRYDSLDRPQSVQDDIIQTPEGPRKRRRVVLTAHGCSVATCSMCPLPDEAVDGRTPVTLDHWMSQLRGALYDCPADLHTLTLLHNGNFFADREVPPEWRDEIYRFLRTTPIKEFVVESLPQYLTTERRLVARHGLERIKLVVAIGLQSSSRLVRELCITSTCKDDTFQEAVQMLKAQGDDVQVFLLFHPPFLTIEESIWDLRASIRYCQALGVTPTICSMRIAPNTVVADLAAKGLYQAPTLFNLAEALLHIENVRVAASLLPPDADPRWTAPFHELNQTGKMRLLVSSARPWTEPKREDVLQRIEGYLKVCA